CGWAAVAGPCHQQRAHAHGGMLGRQRGNLCVEAERKALGNHFQGERGHTSLPSALVLLSTTGPRQYPPVRLTACCRAAASFTSRASRASCKSLKGDGWAAMRSFRKRSRATVT